MAENISNKSTLIIMLFINKKARKYLKNPTQNLLFLAFWNIIGYHLFLLIKTKKCDD